MVSSISHTLRGATPQLELAFAVVLALWGLSIALKNRLGAAILVALCFIPSLLLPDYTFPLTSDYGGLISSFVGYATHPMAMALLTVLLAICIVAHLLSRPPIPEKFTVDMSVGEDFVVVGSGKEPELDDIPTLVAEMRTAFKGGITRPLALRKEQLKNLRRFFVENEAAILKALKEDLGRPEFEGLVYDALIPTAEIEHLINNLERLAANKKVGFNLLSFPSKQWLQEEPLGVALVISTWNYPLMLALVPAAGAIAAGNAVVLKPCNVSKATSRLMAELLPQYMDPRFLSVVGSNQPGDRHTTARLLQEKFDIIFFTGGTEVGKVVLRGAAEHLTPCILELGGKNPVFLDSNADIDLAAKRCVFTRNLNSGQQCISCDYVLVQKEALEEFCTACKKYIDIFYGKDAKDNGTFGRIVGDKQFERLVGVMKSAGGRWIAGGPADADSATRHIPPSVVVVDKDSPAMAEETFGPILLVVPVESVDEAIDVVNNKPKPLSLYIFSNSSDYQRKIMCNTSSGGVTINGCLFHAGHPGLPFGGVGASGMGAYHGDASFQAFSHQKPVLSKSTWNDFGLLSDPMFIYPPWNNFKIGTIRAIIKNM